MMFLWIFLFAGIIYFFYDKRDFLHKSSFDEILDKRLAKGDITIEEYKHISNARKNK